MKSFRNSLAQNFEHPCRVPAIRISVHSFHCVTGLLSVLNGSCLVVHYNWYDKKNKIIETSSRPEFSSLPPSQIVPRLADMGIFIAYESRFYRVLREVEQVNRRGQAKAPARRSGPQTHVATKPNELWAWDIAYLASQVRGQYFYLYMVEDIFSRRCVAWEVYNAESGDYATELIQRAVIREQCFHKPLILYSDNGSPMKSQTLRAKLSELKITPSHSRPRVSNDNDFAESLFRTFKYAPQWSPKGFQHLRSQVLGGGIHGVV